MGLNPPGSGGSTCRAGKNKNNTPKVPKQEKKKDNNSRAKFREAFANTGSSITEFLSERDITRQENTRNLKEYKENKHRTGGGIYPYLPTEKIKGEKNTKKPKNMEYKHESNAFREEINLTRHDIEDSWIVVSNGKKTREE
jgi:ribosomal protein S30